MKWHFASLLIILVHVLLLLPRKEKETTRGKAITLSDKISEEECSASSYLPLQSKHSTRRKSLRPCLTLRRRVDCGVLLSNIEMNGACDKYL